MTATTLLRVPTPLHAQLKTLAALRSTTMVSLLHGIVRDAIAAGELPDTVPGFALTLNLDQTPPRMILEADDAILAEMTASDAREIADKLDSVTKRGGTAYVVLERWQVMIRNVGPGVAIERQDPLGGEVRRTLSLAYAAELAATLRRSIPDA